MSDVIPELALCAVCHHQHYVRFDRMAECAKVKCACGNREEVRTSKHGAID
jgi:hypothetical protein